MDIPHVSTILLNLPLALQANLLGSWLTNFDVGFLDTALCSKEMRPQFLNTLKSGVIFLHTPDLTELELICSWMEWVVQRKVYIDACHLSSAVPPDLYKRFFVAVCKNLKRATIFANSKVHSKTEYSSIIATIAYNCRNLTEIQLQQCESLDGVENLLRACQETLTVVNLLNCDLTKLKLGDIHLSSLFRLMLEDCSGVSGTVTSGFLDAAPNLEILVLRSFSVLSLGFRIPEKLRVLVLSESLQLTDTVFCSLMRSLPRLELLELSDCPLLTDTSIIELVQCAKHLRALYIGENTNFSDRALKAIAKHCGERLRQLYLNDCESITNRGVNYISERCHQLEGINIELMDQISPAAIMSILRINPLLQEVTLDCVRARKKDGDELLTVLSTCCPLLVFCCIDSLKGYTADGMFDMIESCTHLRTLVVPSDCTVVNPFSRLLLEQLHPEIKIEVVCRMSPTWAQYSCSFGEGTLIAEEEDEN